MGGQKGKRTFSPDFGKIVKQQCGLVFPDLSGREIATKLDISSAYFFDIINGKVPPPSPKIVVDIARLLKIDEAMLMVLAGHRSSIVRSPNADGSVSVHYLLTMLEVLEEKGYSHIPHDMVSFLSHILMSEKYEDARNEVARRMSEENKRFLNETSTEKRRCFKELTAKPDLQVAEPKMDYGKDEGSDEPVKE